MVSYTITSLRKILLLTSFTEELTELLKSRSRFSDAKNGMSVSQTMARWQDGGKNLLRSYDLHNSIRKAMAEEAGDQPRTQYLVKRTEDDGVHVVYHTDESKNLTHLFLAKKDLLNQFTRTPEVLLMDCTYKTNKYGVPLLNIVGVNGMNKTLDVAHCFMRGETAEDYAWTLTQLEQCFQCFRIAPPQVIFVDRDLALLKALKSVLPTVPVMLCLWHVFKAVEAHARRVWPQLHGIDENGHNVQVDSPEHVARCDHFKGLIDARTEAEYEQLRHAMFKLHTAEATYIDDTWLEPWKEYLVCCWTDRHLHFGIHSTSRAERYHSALKSRMPSGSGDLLTFYHIRTTWSNDSIKKHREAFCDTAKVRTDLKSKQLYVPSLAWFMSARWTHVRSSCESYQTHRAVDTIQRLLVYPVSTSFASSSIVKGHYYRPTSTSTGGLR